MKAMLGPLQPASTRQGEAWSSRLSRLAKPLSAHSNVDLTAHRGPTIVGSVIAISIVSTVFVGL